MKFLILTLCVTAVFADWRPLDSDEMKLVKTSWEKVKHNEVDILYNIFKQNPDIQAKFTQFAGKDLETLKGTTSFATHATRIVSFLSDFILLMENNKNLPGIKVIVNQMGQNHKNRGVTKDQFNEFKNTFFEYMHASGDLQHAWNDAFDNLYYIVFSNLDGHPVA
ncbi:hypothetical protein PVAND_006721 [Polypedilum vanderplanki]|nr:hypothetical protein PVAND_006721 [Polypedilum vanderplanki]BAH97748.1 globin2 [Polypedilum vanderplanki]